MPSRYTGLWKRESIQLGESAPNENATVFWLQAGTYFADIRIPIKQPALPPGQTLLQLEPAALLPFAQFEAFAGTIAATDTWIRWYRTIDFLPNPDRVDQGHVHFEGDALIEIGEFMIDGDRQRYREVWVPQSLQSSDYWAIELEQEVNLTTQAVKSPRALFVAVGEHFIHIYDDRGYPPEFVAPDPAVSPDALRTLMQFQVNYGQRVAPGIWEIQLSNDPSRVGQSFDRINYQMQGADRIVETLLLPNSETIARYWQVRECSNRAELLSTFGEELLPDD